MIVEMSFWISGGVGGVWIMLNFRFFFCCGSLDGYKWVDFYDGTSRLYDSREQLVLQYQHLYSACFQYSGRVIRARLVSTSPFIHRAAVMRDHHRPPGPSLVHRLS